MEGAPRRGVLRRRRRIARQPSHNVLPDRRAQQPAALEGDPMTLPPLIPRALLFGDPKIRFPRISPDGTQLAYLAPHRGALSVWVRSIAASDDRTGDHTNRTDDRVIAHDPARGIRWFHWQGDSRGVLYAQDRAGDENYHLFQADL